MHLMITKSPCLFYLLASPPCCLFLKHSSLHYFTIDFSTMCSILPYAYWVQLCGSGGREEVVLVYKDGPMNKGNFKELMALETGIGQRKAVYLEGCL